MTTISNEEENKNESSLDQEDEQKITEDSDKNIVTPNSDDNSKVMLNALETKFTLAKKVINHLKAELSNLERLLESEAEASQLEDLVKVTATKNGELTQPVNDGKIVEGVFDGQNMIGSDGKLYMVPPNYASKSKLVEGDIMKLTIQPNGSFLYKQIGPIERQRVIGTLVKDDVTGDWKVIAENKKYNILTASVTYFKGDNNDDCVVLIPKNAPSKWAAVENIIRHE